MPEVMETSNEEFIFFILSESDYIIIFLYVTTVRISLDHLCKIILFN